MMVPETLTEAELLLEGNLTLPQYRSLSCGSVAFFSHPSPDRTDSNEDALAILPVGNGAAVLAVADGLGGQSAGEVAARTALECLSASVRNAAEGNLRSAILDGLEEANQRIIALGTGAATTISAIEIGPGSCRPYHVGDSLILLSGGRGSVKWQTIPHSPVGYGIEAGLLDEEKSLHHKDRHLISNCVGSPEMRIEIGPPITFSPRDTLVLASDGLSDNLAPAEIVERIRKGPMKRAAVRLAEDAMLAMKNPAAGQPGKFDDLTFILYRPR